MALAHVGHQGMVKTKALIRSKVWFPEIDRMVEREVKSCLECQIRDTAVVFEPLRPSEMPTGPWVEVSGDFYGPFSDGSYWYINHCDFSRFYFVSRVASLVEDKVIFKLEEIFSEKGIPRIYKTDNGPPFNSKRFVWFAKRLGFVHRFVTPYWPRANGEVERVMRNLTKVVQNAKIKGVPKEE